MLTAAECTAVLINMNADNIDASLQRLHDGTVGQPPTSTLPCSPTGREAADAQQRQDRVKIDIGAIASWIPSPCHPTGSNHEIVPPARTDSRCWSRHVGQ